MSEELIKNLIDRIEELEFIVEELKDDTHDQLFELGRKIAEVENEAYEEFVKLHNRLGWSSLPVPILNSGE
jgi:hypothetical protein